MPIDTRTFGAPAQGAQAGEPLFGNLQNLGNSNSDRKDRPAAQIWVNLGYPVGEAGTEDYRFVSLPNGIPLDTMEELPVRSTTGYGKFTAARNGLMKQMQDETEKLEPGEERLIGPIGDTKLYLQLRRVNAPVEAPASDESNPYSTKIFG